MIDVLSVALGVVLGACGLYGGRTLTLAIADGIRVRRARASVPAERKAAV